MYLFKSIFLVNLMENFKFFGLGYNNEILTDLYLFYLNLVKTLVEACRICMK